MYSMFPYLHKIFSLLITWLNPLIFVNFFRTHYVLEFADEEDD